MSSPYQTPVHSWLATFLYSYGSECPAEVIWGINEMVDWLKDTHGFTELEYLIEPYSPEWESGLYNESERVDKIADALNQLHK